MRFTRAAPADATSSRTPPTSREKAPLIGASKTSTAGRLDVAFAVRVAAARLTGRFAFAAFLAPDLVFALFAIRTL